MFHAVHPPTFQSSFPSLPWHSSTSFFYPYPSAPLLTFINILLVYFSHFRRLSIFLSFHNLCNCVTPRIHLNSFVSPHPTSSLALSSLPMFEYCTTLLLLLQYCLFLFGTNWCCSKSHHSPLSVSFRCFVRYNTLMSVTLECSCILSFLDRTLIHRR